MRYAIADALGLLNYALIPGYRRNVRANLDQVHKGAGLPPVTNQDVRNVFLVSSRNWADLLVCPKRTEAQFRSDVEMDAESIANLDHALALGKGCVLVTAHVGAFDFIGHYLHAVGYPLVILTTRTTSRLVFDGVTYLRQANGLALVDANASGVRKALVSLHKGEFAVVVSDRDFFSNGISVPFFGRETTLPQGAVRMARDTGAVVVPIFGRRKKRGHQIIVLPPLAIEKTDDLQVDLKQGLGKIVEVMEAAIAAAPSQWVMFQAVWPPEVPASV